jgi:hypothetical protein
MDIGLDVVKLLAEEQLMKNYNKYKILNQTKHYEWLPILLLYYKE